MIRSLFSDLKYLLVLNVLMVLACEPAELPDPVDTDPIFFSELVLDGEKQYWGSGKDGYYNFASFEKVRDNAVRFSSILQKDSCTYPCPSSFRVDIYSFDAFPVGGVDPVTQFRPGSRRWDNAAERTLHLLINADLSLSQGSVNDLRSKWYLNGDAIGADVLNISTELTDTAGGFELCTDLANSWGAYQRICNRVVDPLFRPMTVTLEAGKDSSSMAKFASRVQFGKPPYNYFWNGRQGTAVHQTQLPRDTSTLSFLVKDDAGNTVSLKNKVYASEPGLFAINGQMKVQLERKPVLPPLFGKVALRYVDKNGLEYSSALGPQEQGSYFKVEEIQLFSTSPGERPVAKVQLSFTCEMFDVSGRSIHVENGKATMVFRFPE